MAYLGSGPWGATPNGAISGPQTPIRGGKTDETGQKRILHLVRVELVHERGHRTRRPERSGTALGRFWAFFLVFGAGASLDQNRPTWASGTRARRGQKMRILGGKGEP